MWISLRTLARALGGFLIGAGIAFALAMVLPHRRARRDAGLPLPTPGPSWLLMPSP
jgi:ABC-type nitrate/sulfonate/bicarbonate transport system permease component